MAFYGYNGDTNQCYWTPYTSNYHYASSAYSYDESSEPDSAQHFPCNLFATASQLNYSWYEPAGYVTGYVSSGKEYRICYSNQGLSVPIFKEYDPTPYGGGYDPAQVYGKPLPPSDKICYPLSDQPPKGFSLGGFSFSAIPSPYGKKQDNRSLKPEKNRSGERSIDEPKGHHEDEKGVDGQIEEYGYGSMRQAQRIPYGSGLEAMDICECIFGQFPCLDKINRERCGNQEAVPREKNCDPWKSTADYLFGWEFMYGDPKDGSYGDYAWSHGSY